MSLLNIVTDMVTGWMTLFAIDDEIRPETSQTDRNGQQPAVQSTSLLPPPPPCGM